MAIYDTYATLITEEIVKEILSAGENPSSSEIISRFNTFVASNDISNPLFDSNNYKVDFGESSSVSSINDANNNIQKDVKVLYKHMFKVSDQLINNFERWRYESKLLEGRLDDLEERITSLLLVSSDTSGFFNFVQDNFVDNSKVDLSQTTAYINVAKQIASIGTSSAGATRHLFPNIRDEDVEFAVLSKTNLVATVSAPTSRTRNAMNDVNSFWQDRVYTSQPGPVTGELKVDFGEELEISRIDIDLHQSSSNSFVQITPMISTDNYNFTQLNTVNFTRQIIDKSMFQFPPVVARYVKFIMTKTGFDLVNNNIYSYEFGVDEISFFNEGFTEDSAVTLVSQPLSVLDTDRNPEQFSKIVLEVCEDVPDGTTIEYAVAAFNDEDQVLTSSSFINIDPLNRKNTVQPTALDFGDLDSVSISGVKVSYDSSSEDSTFINPSKSWTLAESVSAGSVSTTSGISSAARYSFFNSNERILDNIVGSGIQIAQGTLEVWRNVNTKGTTNKIRTYSNGWGFEDPYYKTTVYVANPTGANIDFGGKAVIIDGVSQSGKVNVSQGRHIVWVHKDNWKTINISTVTNLVTLKTADSLYPYNHRYLVEGFAYPTAYPDDDEEIYKGFDIVAEYFMKEVSVFDMIHNVQASDYDKFGIDYDAEDVNSVIVGTPGTKKTSRVFLIKVDENNPDFINEEFLIKFKSVNSLFKYLRLKATFETTDTTVTPFLDSYRIKISS